MTNNTLTRKQLVEAYNTFPCEKWKATIRELLVKHALALDEDSIAIPTEDLQLLVKEGTDAQKNYVKSLGVAFPGDDNAFIKDCSSLQTEVKNMSEKLFGDNLVFQILGGHTPIDRPELKGRAFYLHSAYKLETIPAKAGTAIIISKK